MFSDLICSGFKKAGASSLLICALAACSPAPDIEIRDAQVRDLLPGRDTTAGYFVLRNNSAATVTLTGATSPHARSIEMHRTFTKDDRVRMQRVREYAIEPGEEVAFAPGGLHLMIFGVKDMPEPFIINLQFSDERQVCAPFSKLAHQ